MGACICLQSLDEEEHLLFKQKVKSKSYYINRKTVENRVRRQPFYGDDSSFGMQAKSTGPNFNLGPLFSRIKFFKL